MKISVSELKCDIDKYIAMAEQEDIVVMKDETPVAKIVSASTAKGLSLDTVFEDFSKLSDLEIAKLNDSVKNQYSRLSPSINALADIVGEHGGKEQGNMARMQRYLEILIDTLQKRDDYKEEVASWDKYLFLLSTQLHDIGEAAVTGHYLKKAGELTEEEYAEIKAHTDLGISIVQRAKADLELGLMFQYAEVVAGSHHEKWDGTGYPQGLKADGIPLQGRLMAIVDVYSALTAVRPHRERKTHEEAIEIIKSCSGTYFDPAIVEAFLESENEIKQAH